MFSNIFFSSILYSIEYGIGRKNIKWPTKLISVRFAVRIAVVHVLAVRSGVRETFQAFAALKWLLAAVQTLVFSQMVFVFERFRTFEAFVGTLTCLDGIMENALSHFVLFWVTRIKSVVE